MSKKVKDKKLVDASLKFNILGLLQWWLRKELKYIAENTFDQILYLCELSLIIPRSHEENQNFVFFETRKFWTQIFKILKKLFRNIKLYIITLNFKIILKIFKLTHMNFKTINPKKI